MTMPLIIPIFIMQRGCPHRCIFCNQQAAVGPYPEHVSEAFFRQTVRSHLQYGRNKTKRVQIAFYGGNFTGLPAQDRIRLLNYARPFLDAGTVHGLRISTRPDCLDRELLESLKKSGVQTVEIGAQSLMDEVLRRAGRGHTAADVDHAVRLLKACGFEVGLHLMAGLPADSPGGFAFSVERTIAMQPHMVRIHPTLVFKGTPLERDYRNGRYEPLMLNEAVLLCKSALLEFAAAGIPVVRMGLQTTPEMEKSGTIVAGPYHPAFRLLVESAIFYDKAAALVSKTDFREKSVAFCVRPNEQSALRGLKNCNLRTLQKCFGLSSIRIFTDAALNAGTLKVCRDA